MPDFAITVDEILKGAQTYDSQAHMALRAAQTVALGEHLTVCFESRQTAIGFLQSLIAYEGLSCPVSLLAECDEAASLWQLPQGTLCLTLTLLPKAKMTPSALCAALAGPIASLCLDVGGHLCPVTLEGSLSPRSVARVSLPQAAQRALTQGGMQVALRWQGITPDRIIVPEALWRAWPQVWAQGA